MALDNRTIHELLKAGHTTYCSVCYHVAGECQCGAPLRDMKTGRWLRRALPRQQARPAGFQRQ